MQIMIFRCVNDYGEIFKQLRGLFSIFISREAVALFLLGTEQLAFSDASLPWTKSDLTNIMKL